MRILRTTPEDCSWGQQYTVQLVRGCSVSHVTSLGPPPRMGEAAAGCPGPHTRAEPKQPSGVRHRRGGPERRGRAVRAGSHSQANLRQCRLPGLRRGQGRVPWWVTA